MTDWIEEIQKSIVCLVHLRPGISYQVCVSPMVYDYLKEHLLRGLDQMEEPNWPERIYGHQLIVVPVDLVPHYALIPIGEIYYEDENETIVD